MANNAPYPANISSRETLPSISSWTPYYVTGSVLVVLLACLVLKSMAPLILVLILAMVVLTPLLLRLEKQMFWAWLLLFPVVYYDPVRIASLLLGEKSNIAIPLFLAMVIPGACLSLLSRWPEHHRLVPITLPLWFIIVGFFLNIFRYKELFSISYLIRDGLGIFITLYLLTIGWRMMRESRQSQHKILMALMGIGMLNAVAIIIEHYLHVGLVNAGGFDRPMGIFGFPILASFISLMTLVLALYGFFMAETSKTKSRYGICILLLLLGCVMSLSKANIAQILLILGMWGLFLPRQLKIKAIGFALGLGLVFLLWETFADHGNLVNTLTERFSRTDTLAIRQSAWQIVASKLDFETVLWGKGWMSATELLGIHNYNYALFPVDLMSKGGPSAIHPHNAYLKYTYEMGIFGIGMLLSYGFIMIRGFCKAITAPRLEDKLANLSIGSLVMVLLFASLTTTPMAENYTQLYISITLLYMGFNAGWFSQGETLVAQSNP